MRDERAVLVLAEGEREAFENPAGAVPGELVREELDFRLEAFGEVRRTKELTPSAPTTRSKS